MLRVAFFASEKPRERLISDAFLRGVIAHGDDGVMIPVPAEPVAPADVDVVVMIGVKSRELWRACWGAGRHLVYLDKGYTRHGDPDAPVKVWKYWRVAVDGHQPTPYLMDVARPLDRWSRLSIPLKPWRRRVGKGHILFAGSSQKYHDFYKLTDPTTYAGKVIRQIRATSLRRIVYRPKPSWHDAVPIDGSRFSTLPETIDQALSGAFALVTHGSNACFEAMVAGVPSVILGEAVARPISATDLAAIDGGLIYSDQREQLLANLAYCQWTAAEMSDGTAWDIIKGQIHAR